MSWDASANPRARQPLRFAAVGVVNTTVTLAVIYGAKYFLALGDAPANLAGYVIGLLVSFLLNSAWTFAYRGEVIAALVRFCLAFALSYCLNLSVVLFLIQSVQFNDYLSHLAGMPIYTACFFLTCKFFVFRESAARRGP